MGNLTTPKSVQKLQMALYAKAKAEAGYRFYALYDKISREDSRRNVRNVKRIDLERAELQPLPGPRTSDCEEVGVRVSSSGGFTLRKEFYTVPSGLIGHRLRLFDDRLDLFVRGTQLMTLTRPHASGKHDQVVDYRHVIHSLRKRPSGEEHDA